MPIADVRRELAADTFENAKTIIGLNKLVEHLDSQLLGT